MHFRMTETDEGPGHSSETDKPKERNALFGISTGGRLSPFPLTYEEAWGETPWYQLPEWRKNEIYEKRGISRLFKPKETEDTKPQE